MFRSAILKLTGLYLFLLMAVSVFFSLNLYRISTVEINNRLQRQIDFVYNTRSGVAGIAGEIGATIVRPTSVIEQKRLQELRDSKAAIARQLVYANFAILLAGGIGSYLLARRTLEPIEEAHAAQSRFAADASHELRTPLAAMRAETEVTLRDPKLTLKEAKSQLASNLEELERLSELSEGLLQLARGGNDVVKEKVNLQALVNKAIRRHAPQAAAKKITIKPMKIAKTSLQANPTQLTQALVILLDNAIKYSPKNSSVTVTSETSHHQVQVRVADTGPGMQPHELDQIFDRFYRADTARSSGSIPGYGLGLAIAKQIAESHDGSLTAQSELGKGACFTITLPLK